MKAIFTTSPSSIYDDLPEQRYHFPRTYLNQVKEAVGDWIIYYEPRRDSGPKSSGGRQAYFAVARVVSVHEDASKPDHYYAEISDYLEFDRSVPFREGAHFYESALKKTDGSTSKGAFGRAVRGISNEEYALILKAGFTDELAPWETPETEESMVAVDRPIYDQLIRRPFRDRAFQKQVRAAYKNTCAVTGLCLINGGGRPEVEAAHIRPVEKNGPDSVRNGLALTGTVHWLFDRGLISLDEDYRLLVSDKGLPEGLQGLISPGRQINLPEHEELKPHPGFLEWHRIHHRFRNIKI